MWKPLQNLLLSPSSPDRIKKQTLWVIGTAIQNNPSAQTAVRFSSIFLSFAKQYPVFVYYPDTSLDQLHITVSKFVSDEI